MRYEQHGDEVRLTECVCKGGSIDLFERLVNSSFLPVTGLTRSRCCLQFTVKVGGHQLQIIFEVACLLFCLQLFHTPTGGLRPCG
jgi:hypothetical protein